MTRERQYKASLEMDFVSADPPFIPRTEPPLSRTAVLLTPESPERPGKQAIWYGSCG